MDAKANERMWKVCANPNVNNPPHFYLIIILNSVHVDIIFNGNVLHSSVFAIENDRAPSSSSSSSSGGGSCSGSSSSSSSSSSRS